MKVNFRGIKTCVFGIQGSGKTYFTREFILSSFRHPIIYQIHEEDFKTTPKNVMTYTPQNINSVAELGEMASKIKVMAINKKVDAFVIDEADLWLRENLAIPQPMTDLILNHRHYPPCKKDHQHYQGCSGIGIVMMSRRPQDIPTKIVESSENLIVFAIEGENVVRKFNKIHPKFKELLPKLSIDKHNYIFKRVGSDPILCEAIKYKGDVKIDNQKENINAPTN